MPLNDKTRFLLINLSKGLIWLVVLVGIMFIINHYLGDNPLLAFSYNTSNTIVVFCIFILSELLFGLIPPELFMIWSLGFEDVSVYSCMIAVFAVLSYVSGVIGFFFGRNMAETYFFKLIKKRFLGKYEEHLRNFGSLLILVASLTPVPFSAICMLVGSVKFSRKRFFLWALLRFGRFIIYAAIIWEAQII